MAAVMSLSAHFPISEQEPPASLRHSTSLLSASGSFPILAALFVEEAVDAISEMAAHLTLSQTIRAGLPAAEESLAVSAHVNPPKPVEASVVVVASVPAAEEEDEPRDIYDGLDEEEYLYDYEDDGYDYEDIEWRVLKLKKMERRPQGAASLPLRATKDNKYPKVRPNKRYGHRLVAKMERITDRKLEGRMAAKTGRPVAIYVPTYTGGRHATQEERDLEEAIRRSRREGHVTASVSVNQLMDLQNRELTPEDYELLLLLDESVEKKKVSKDAFSSFTQTVLTKDLDVDCPICMSPMVTAEKVTTLPCSHQYHTPCIEQWLTMSSPNCPLDGLSLLHDH
jgi:hypothetical protein